MVEPEISFCWRLVSILPVLGFGVLRCDVYFEYRNEPYFIYAIHRKWNRSGNLSGDKIRVFSILAHGVKYRPPSRKEEEVVFWKSFTQETFIGFWWKTHSSRHLPGTNPGQARRRSRRRDHSINDLHQVLNNFH